MGFDCGFDIVPRLQDTPNDNAKWKAVMDEVTITFLHDPVVVTKAKYLEFQVGEYPLLPFQGHKLLRFSSKISSERTQNAEQYIKAVCRIAKRHLGEQVQFWHEAADNYGHYDWGAVNESFKDMLSDEKVDFVPVINGIIKLTCGGTTFSTKLTPPKPRIARSRYMQSSSCLGRT
jgi:hypothetical protein